MYRVRLVLLSLVAVLSVAALSAPAASAIGFEYKVEGKKLEAGSSKTFTVSSDGKVSVLKMTVAGAASELLSNKISVLSGANIKGGIPGTNEEQMVFGNVTVDKPAKCAVKGGQIETTLLASEIVEGASGGVGNGEADILFRPKSTENEILAAFEFVNNGAEECALKNTTGNLTGLILAVALPQKAETLNGELDDEANTKEYKNSKGEFKTAGLKFAGNATTLAGLTLVILTTDEKYGAF